MDFEIWHSPIDHFSSKEAFEKVYNSLKGMIGVPTWVVKPEVSGGRCDSEGIHEEYDDGSSFGILRKEPFLDKQRGIVLPMDEYVYGFLDFISLEKRQGSIQFHCLDSKDVEVSIDSSKKMNSRIKIYSGEDILLCQFDNILSIDYFRMLNLLGEKVPEQMLEKYSKIIKSRKNGILGELEILIKKNIGGSYINKPEFEKASQSILEYGLQQNNINLGRGVIVNVGDYFLHRS